MRLALSVLLAAGMAAPIGAHAQPGTRAPALLVHGNYCGPGNNGPLAPVDALDAACARHDACTPDGGLPPRACNLRLQREAEAISRDRRQPDDLRAMAGLVAASTGLIPSEIPDLAMPAAVQRRPILHRSAITPDLPIDIDEADEE